LCLSEKSKKLWFFWVVEAEKVFLIFFSKKREKCGFYRVVKEGPVV